MVQQTMSLCQIAPFVRFAADVYVTDSGRQIRVTAYDHRLFYVVSGNGVIEVNGTQKEVRPGTVLYWRSGTAYVIRPTEGAVLHMIAVNFDFTQQNIDTVQYLPMVQDCDYRAEARLEDITFSEPSVFNAPLILQDVPGILPYLKAMVQETSAPKNYGYFQLCNLMRICLVHLSRAASQRQQTKSAGHSSDAILDYIHGHYGEELNNKMLAEKFHYHPNYLSQLIVEQTGLSLHQYLIMIRIRQALYLLQTTELPIQEIARQVGFKSPSYFSYYFKQCTGHSPRKFRI